MKMRRILHITPHMGGGVGKAVSGLIKQAAQNSSAYEHRVVCLEKAEKSQFVSLAQSAGCQFIYAPSNETLADEIEKADIVQLEFWNHPAIVKFLGSLALDKVRLLVWCHISGIHFPIIPAELIQSSQRFLLTSECSYESLEIGGLSAAEKEKLRVVSSGGIDGLPHVPNKAQSSSLKSGYIGTLNFSKLHPHYIRYASSVDDPSFSIQMFGDQLNHETLLDQCKSLNRSDLLKFKGYTDNVARELSELDLFPYILNPYHYGTAENALLEAMAMGVIPIVLGNPCERAIVEHGRTGIVVNNPKEFSDAYQMLSDSSVMKHELSAAAMDYARVNFTNEKIESQFISIYDELMEQPKDRVDFTGVFGGSPVESMSKFYRDFSIFTSKSAYDNMDKLSRYSLYERTKGSVFHFLDYFPDDLQLRGLADFINKNKSLDPDALPADLSGEGGRLC